MESVIIQLVLAILNIVLTVINMNSESYKSAVLSSFALGICLMGAIYCI